jgi:DNA polymerase-4
MNEVPIRKIIHVDMDAFYASVEQMDDLSLKGKPVAVGGSKERGVVAAASYEARKFGVRSAMPSSVAARRCPELIFVKPRFERYKELSSQIRGIFHDYTELVEPLSLDEAFLDVTENKIGHPSATILAQEIRYRIFHEVGLTASAGISINKFTAKIASDINKPNGQRTIPPEEVLSFLENLPIQKFFGVGKVTAEKMKFHGIFTGRDLKERSLEYLSQHFGKSGQHFYNIVRGIQYFEVKPDRERKSVGAERTFSKDIREGQFMSDELRKIANEIEKRLTKTKLEGRTVTLKIKYQDFTQQTRSKTFEKFVSDAETIYEVGVDLLSRDELKDSVRLLGLTVSNLNNPTKEKDVLIQTQIEF